MLPSPIPFIPPQAAVTLFGEVREETMLGGGCEVQQGQHILLPLQESGRDKQIKQLGLWVEEQGWGWLEQPDPHGAGHKGSALAGWEQRGPWELLTPSLLLTSADQPWEWTIPACTPGVFSAGEHIMAIPCLPNLLQWINRCLAGITALGLVCIKEFN